MVLHVVTEFTSIAFEQFQGGGGGGGKSREILTQLILFHNLLATLGKRRETG